jgi:hypothetical protein
MDETQLGKKIQEWLALKEEADVLEKARVEEGPSDQQKRSIRQERAEAPMGPTGTTERFSPKGKLTPVGMMQRWHNVRQLSNSPKPNLPKTEKAEQPPEHEDIVAGVKLPFMLKEHVGAVPHDHPHRELAAKFVADVWKKNVPEGRRMSAKYLGIGGPGIDNKETKKSMQAAPASVSEPVIMNRVDNNQNKVIDSPNTVNPYKDIFNSLRKQDRRG